VAVEAAPSGAAAGLVRRLSVTARPGDIFYKVKDVTESSSTTDTLTCDPTAAQEHREHEQEQEIIIQSTASLNNNDTLSFTESSSVSTTSTSNISPKSETISRKTTTWNVRRNQSTNLGITTPNNNTNNNNNSREINHLEKIFKTKVSKDTDQTYGDVAISDKSSLSNGEAAEPGSPSFSKELLSIRMQLKEKKILMEKDKRKLESELERQRQTISKQVFLQVVQKKGR
jgi:hypothetical protein